MDITGRKLAEEATRQSTGEVPGQGSGSEVRAGKKEACRGSGPRAGQGKQAGSEEGRSQAGKEALIFAHFFIAFPLDCCNNGWLIAATMSLFP